MRSRIPLPHHLGAIHNPPHLSPLPLTQLDLATPPILDQPLRPRGPRNSNHPLTRDPRERNLTRRAALAARKVLDGLDNGFVGVEVCALEFGHGAPEVGGGKVRGGCVGEGVDEPAVAERAVGDVGDGKGFGGGDEAVGFVEGFKGRVFGLDGVDAGDWWVGLVDVVMVKNHG
jgi:hypothetical protein